VGRGKSIPQFRWYELALQLGKDDRDEVMETKDPTFSERRCSHLLAAFGWDVTEVKRLTLTGRSSYAACETDLAPPIFTGRSTR
jgi:hypothetical protein